MKFIKWVLFLGLWQTVLAIAAPIKVEVDRNSVNFNESFQVIFSTTEEPDGQPDFRPLEKDFEILNQSQSKNSSWINGVINRSVRWELEVMAKRAGKLTIPAVHFGRETSPELGVTVGDNPAPANTANNSNVTDNSSQADTLDAANHNAEMFLEVEATPTKPYLQQQVLYTLRFFRRVNIAEASLKDPEIPDAVVTKLDEDKNYRKELNGVEYAVTERRYAIFPQKSGVLTIPSLTLTAAVVENNDPSGFGGFFGMQSTRRTRVASKEIKLEVQPALPNFKGQWLAANNLELKQDWSGNVLQMKVGEPLTRTLTLTVQGATVGSVPKLQQTFDNADLKSYPDQPRTEEQKTPYGIVAIREEKVAFIASKAGTYTLPAIEIPWFNVQTQTMELANLPAVTIVASGVGKVAEAPKVAPPVDKTVDKQRVIPSTTPIAVKSFAENNFLWQGLAAFFGIAWLVTLALFFKAKRKKPQPETLKNPENSVNPVNRVLKQACADNDAYAAKQALLSWGKQHYNVMSLGALAEFCDARLRDEVLTLNQHLYSQQSANWEGKRLFQTFSEHQAMAKNRAKMIQPEALEPLHRI